MRDRTLPRSGSLTPWGRRLSDKGGTSSAQPHTSRFRLIHSPPGGRSSDVARIRQRQVLLAAPPRPSRSQFEPLLCIEGQEHRAEERSDLTENLHRPDWV